MYALTEGYCTKILTVEPRRWPLKKLKYVEIKQIKCAVILTASLYIIQNKMCCNSDSFTVHNTNYENSMLTNNKL
jgi:hypothetical protein